MSLQMEQRMSTAKRTSDRSYPLWDHGRRSKHPSERNKGNRTRVGRTDDLRN